MEILSAYEATTINSYRKDQGNKLVKFPKKNVELKSVFLRIFSNASWYFFRFFCNENYKNDLKSSINTSWKPLGLGLLESQREPQKHKNV